MTLRLSDNHFRLQGVNEGAIPRVWYGHLYSWGTYYHYTPTSHTRDTVRRIDHFITISPSRGKNHTLYLYLPELFICVKGITEIVFYFKGQRRNEDPFRIGNFFTSRAFYLIFLATWCYRVTTRFPIFPLRFKLSVLSKTLVEMETHHFLCLHEEVFSYE